MKLTTGKNITSGNLFVGILTFVFPLFISTLVQSLFTTVDTMVVGNFADSTAVAAIGATVNVIALLVNCFVGISNSASVLVARAVGANDKGKTKQIVDTSLIFAAVFGLFLMVCALVLTIPVLRLLKCPEVCFDSSVLYLRIYMCGTPFVLIYNFAIAIIRAEGDSQRPLVYTIISGVINVVTNILLCLILPNKVAAVAIATVTSQVVSAFLAMWRLMTKKDGCCHFSFKDLCFHRKSLFEIFRYGIPLVLSSAIYPIANLQIQSAINSYGAAVLAGQTAGMQISNLVVALQTAFNSACLIFVSQNIGAHNPKRVGKTIFLCSLCSLASGFIFGFSCSFLFPEPLLQLFIPGDAEAIYYGKLYMKYNTSIAGLTGFCGSINAALQAFGHPSFTTLNSFISVLGFRIIWMNFIYVLAPSVEMLFVCFPCSWILITVVAIVFFIHVYHKYRKQESLSQSI